MYQSIEACRICGNKNLVEVLDLGKQALTGVFPKSKDQSVDQIPLVLVKCMGEGRCGLLQLKHTGDLSQMYGLNYGYRSGLNASMVRHLHGKVAKIQKSVNLGPNDLVIDIGSNDSSTLQAYPNECDLYGIDPTGVKFKKYYPSHINLIADFFSTKVFKEHLKDRKAKVITSFSMFYDLEDPMQFMREIFECLDDNGIWVFEQSYMPTMLQMNSYDTICHEHLEYYALAQIQWMAERVGFVIREVEFNDINGGSFSVTVSKGKEAPPASVQKILQKEKEMGLDDLQPYQEFEKRVAEHRQQFRSFLQKAQEEGSRILGYGASTKGNVILQYCGITEQELPCIAEVNEEKFGAYTPGTHIPIVSEQEALRLNPDYYLVLPWHFRKNILEKEQSFLASGGKFVFPLPQVEVTDQS